MIRLSTLAAAAVAAAVLAAPAAFAQDASQQETPKPATSQPDAPKRDRGAAMFKKLDDNGDGVIDKAEFDAPRVKVFERIDKDKDGRITLTEVEVLADRRAKRGDWSDDKKARWIKHIGVTTPQGLTRDEYLAQKSSFTRIDADDDGKLTVTEVEVFFDKVAERRARRAARQQTPDAPNAAAPSAPAAGDDADDVDAGMDDGTDG